MKVAVPAETPVTTPAFVTVATLGLVLTQVPPVLGDRVVEPSTQILLGPVMLTTGIGFTVTGEVGAEEQPVVLFVKINVAEPAETPVTIPALVIVATAGSLLAQVPPEDGDNPVVLPTQMVLGPLMVTVGSGFTVTAGVGAETQPVIASVKVNVAVPAEIPDTTPPLVTVATEGSLLAQVPPVVGDKVVVAPTQMLLEPVMLTAGVALTVTGKVGSDSQPVVELVKMNVTEPADTPVTTPAFVTVATAGLLLAQVPPVVGDKVVVPLIQILLEPVMLTVGGALTVTEVVGRETQPVLVLVKVNVTEPAETPVTTPAFVTVATAGLLLAQVPPVVGERPVTPPMQMLVEPSTLTVGIGLTVTAGVGSETQPVTELVKVKVAVPADTAVTTPAFVTVAVAGSLLTQVPPVPGDKVVVNPTQMLLEPVMLTTGFALTVIVAVGREVQPVPLLVKVNVTEPADTPVTTPALVTVATAGLLLAQVPPVVGDKVVVVPGQMLLAPVMLTVGKATMVTAAVVAEQLGAVLLVKVKVTEPAETPVTMPSLVTVATAGLLLDQVPPVVGDSVVVVPTQIVVEPVMLTEGGAVMVTAAVGSETQPVLVFVKVKVALPAVTPVTTPAFVTVATAGLLLAQVPPVAGDRIMVAPIQILSAPVMLTTGVLLTVTAAVGRETQPVVVLVKVNVAVPAETAVTTPSLVTVATAGLLLTQVPPMVGDNPVVAPIQMLLEPVMETVGKALTVTGAVAADSQPVAVSVKMNVTEPALTPVTTPAFVTVATPALLLAQVPPVVGERVVVSPTQIAVEPVMLTTGNASTVTGVVGSDEQPVFESV